MGQRYGLLPQTSELAGLPSPARALVSTSINVFRATDRGVVRNSNDRTMDNRAATFRNWLSSSCGYLNVCCAETISPTQAIGLLAAFIDHLSATPYNAAGDFRKANTLLHYLNAAANFLESITGQPVPMYTSTGPKPALIPLLGDKIAQRRKWQTPKPKREAYTFEILETLHNQVKTLRKTNDKSFLDKKALVFDTQCLGVFTGSRASEYCQTKGTSTAISRVPAQLGEQPSSTLPIAFIRSDFQFLTRDGTILSHSQLFVNPRAAVQLHITFRHDKSGRNNTTRKFGVGQAWLCPIRAATNILFRASTLGIPHLDPICAYQSPASPGYRFLRDTDITSAMRQACIDTYPNPDHFLRIHIDRISSHSNRIYAAVSLSQAGESIDTIAQRLRWSAPSVSFYLRESATDVGSYTASTIQGAQRNFI